MTIKKKKTKRKSKSKVRKKDISIFRIMLIVLFVSSIVAGGIYQFRKYGYEPTHFESNKYFVKGIDISHHNPILNWEAVAAQNISFAYIKATEGISHKDRNYTYNYPLAKQAGVVTGSYHFYSFGVSGQEQAKHFIETGQFDTGDLIPAIDVEHSTSNIYSKDKEYRAVVVDELLRLEQALYDYFGVHPIIYTNNDCYKLYIKDHFPDNTLWISDLKKEPDNNIKNWRIWQFTHKGELIGWEEPFDLNYYRYSFREFQELLLP